MVAVLSLQAVLRFYKTASPPRTRPIARDECTSNAVWYSAPIKKIKITQSVVYMSAFHTRVHFYSHSLCVLYILLSPVSYLP